MANKILNFGNSNTTQIDKNRVSFDVFKDISMNSTAITKTSYQHEYGICLTVNTKNNQKIPIKIKASDDSKEKKYLFAKWKTINESKVIDSNASTYTLLTPAKFKLNKLTDIKAIYNSLHNIFHWIPGERIINPEFGSNLRNLLYEGITAFNKEQIAAEIRLSINKWEPRVEIQNIIDATDVNDVENNTVRLDVLFRVPALEDDQLYKFSYQQNIFK